MCVCVNAYRRHFSSLLGFSRFSRHAQCDVCSELKARMRLANDPKAKAEAACLFVEHNNAQQEDRRIYYKIRELSRKGDILCIMQDGSDQEKYRVFRCLRQAKDLEGKGPLPRLKLLGSLAHGYVGMFYFIEEDVTKGSALTIEALMTTIEESAKVAQARGRELPHHLWIQLDNAAGENKNQFVFTALANLVHIAVFQTATLAFLRLPQLVWWMAVALCLIGSVSYQSEHALVSDQQ